MLNSAKWWCLLRVIWCFRGPAFRTSWQSSVRPKTLLRRLEKWSKSDRKEGVTRPHRAPVAQNRILGPKNTRSVTSRSVTWRSLKMVLRTGKRGHYERGLFARGISRISTRPSEKGHSRSSRRVPGHSRSNSRNSETDSRNAKFHSRNGISRLEQYENHNSRSKFRSDSRNWWEPTLGNEKCTQTFFLHKLLNTPKSSGHPGKCPGHPRFPPSKAKQNKISRAGTNFSTTTPSRGRPPPHPAVSRNKS